MKSFILMLIAIALVSALSIPAIVVNVLRKVFRSENIKEYFYVIAIGFDQAGGSIIYGQEDWTVSSWTYHLHKGGNKYATAFMKVIDGVFGAGHCEESYKNEIKVQGLPRE